MDKNVTNPRKDLPTNRSEEPLGDLGSRGKTWTPRNGEQGISNRENDEDDVEPYNPDDAA